MAVAHLSAGKEIQLDRPFFEVCDALIEHHLRPITEEDRSLVSKSLFETYIYFAGIQHAFEPVKKTRFMRSLRRFGVRGFAELFLSLHLFNVVSMEIQETVSFGMPDPKSLELYMLGIEAICRDVVTHAVKLADAQLNEAWAGLIRVTIEKRLLSRS
jgi:hypothetical protein